LNNSTRFTSTFPVKEFGKIKEKVLNWAKQFGTFCFLDNHQYQLTPHSQECILAAGIDRSIASDSLSELQQFMQDQPGWLFGHLSYDLKEHLGFAPSTRPDAIGFPCIYFFQPAVLIRFNEHEMQIEASYPDEVFNAIHSTPQGRISTGGTVGTLNYRIPRDEYISIIEKLRGHILRGDCYEINFCQEIYSLEAQVDPVSIYTSLVSISPSPFSALYRMNDKWLICASPERFLAKKGSHVLSQPIKGTSGRKPTPAEDEESRRQLENSTKDRSENVMVVDLVRNDLSKVCREGTVKVDELFGIYTFPQVHQMISTVSGELKPGTDFKSIIEATFPMGSMTGAPKKRVIELIEEYEPSRRGIFSGAVGYMEPNGDFDFNVVIRSVMYNATSHYLSFQAGSGITFYSDPEKEWEECLVKAEAILNVIG